jgi:hypothetical protein
MELRRLPTGREFECDCTAARDLVRGCTESIRVLEGDRWGKEKTWE